MNKGIFVTIFDSKGETYSRPTVAASNADAIRNFELLVNDKQQTLVSLHPEDFTLYRIGSFQDFQIVGEDRQSLANGVDVKRPEAVNVQS